MKAEVLILYNSQKIPEKRLERFRDALRFFGFCCNWCDLDRESEIDDLCEYAVIAALHNGLERTFTPQLASEIEKAIRSGCGFVSFDHDFPNDAAWLGKIKRNGYRKVTSFEFPRSDPFMLAWKESGQKVHWPRPLTIAEVSCSDHDYESLVVAEDSPVVLRHLKRKEVRFLFDSSYWFNADYNDSFGMVDLFWKAIIWAARKPFPVLSVPPFITSRIDDCNGTRKNFSYVNLFNKYGIKPNLGVFLNDIPDHGATVNAMQQLQAENAAQFSPHAFDSSRLLFAEREKGPYPTDVLAENFKLIEEKFAHWQIRQAKTINPHWGHFGANCAEFFEQYGLPYIMQQLRPDEIISRTLHHWHPKPFGNYAFVADKTQGIDSLFSLISHWHPADILKSSGSDTYQVDLDKYSSHVDFLFGRTIFDPRKYYEVVNSDPIDERKWKNPDAVNNIAQAAQTAAEGVRLALQSSFFGCITTHEYSLAVLDDSEIDEMLSEFRRRLNAYELITMDYDAISGYMKTQAATQLLHCSLEGNVINVSADIAICAEQQLYLSIYDGPADDICLRRIPFIEKNSRPALAQKIFYCA